MNSSLVERSLILALISIAVSGVWPMADRYGSVHDAKVAMTSLNLNVTGSSGGQAVCAPGAELPATSAFVYRG